MNKLLTSLSTLGLAVAVASTAWSESSEPTVWQIAWQNLGNAAQTGAAPLPLDNAHETMEPATLEASCLDCHQHVAIHGRKRSGWRQPTSYTGRGNHPVGLDYRTAARRDPDKYKPASSMSEAVVLDEGRITCTTCHVVETRAASSADVVAQADGYSCTGVGFTMGPRIENLCTECHRK